MRIHRIVAAMASAMVASAALGTAASAHPLGNFSVNRYSRIEVGPERTTLRYVLDLAEIPTLQELQAAHVAVDAPAIDVERALLADRAARIAAATRFDIAGRAATWAIRDATLVLPEGQAGLRTMRIALTLIAEVAARSGDAVAYRDANEPGRSGWHEVVVRGVDGVELAGATAPARDASDELRRYPADPTIAPPDVDRATATVRVVGAATALPDAGSAAGVARLGLDAMSAQVGGLIRRGAAGDLFATLLALASAAGLGVAHALTPGHGKTVMAAYLVGTRGTARRALALGGVVAITHTAGVLGLGLVVLGASAVVAPERLYPYLSAASALVVLGIGSWLAAAAVRRYAHERDHVRGRTHDHAHGDHVAGAPTWRALAALGMSGGAVPSASALLLLLAAIALRRPEFGVLLIVAFGVGMAAVLVGIGLSLVGARRLAARRLGPAPWTRRAGALVPAATAATVLVVGIALAVQAGQGVLATLP